MKIIISRKGFDSSFGGCPSPIEVVTQKMMSFPIPGGISPNKFSDIKSPWGDLGEIAKILSKKENFKDAYAHLDPDLNRDSLERMVCF